MKPTVTVVDYGLGNLFSIERAFQHLGADVKISFDPHEVASAMHLILPGVGAFGDGMAQLRARGLFDAVHTFTQTGRPLLGICLGMQLLFGESEEFGVNAGLGLIPGRVIRMKDLSPENARVKIPHYGWDGLVAGPLRRNWDRTVLDGLEQGEFVYFVHSFAAHPDDKSVVAADIEYGGHKYTAVVEKDNVVGCQFHPEKSGEAGLKILANFLKR